MVPAGEAGEECDCPKRTACLQFNGSIAPFGKKKTNLAEWVGDLNTSNARFNRRRLKQPSLFHLPDFAILVRFTSAGVAKLADALA
jgi:hypothetical protein